MVDTITNVSIVPPTSPPAKRRRGHRPKNDAMSLVRILYPRHVPLPLHILCNLWPLTPTRITDFDGTKWVPHFDEDENSDDPEPGLISKGGNFSSAPSLVSWGETRLDM